MLVAITTVQRYSPAFSLEFTIDMARFGFPKVDSSQVFEVARLGPGGAREPQGSFKASAVSFKGVLAARDVLMLVISKANLGMMA